jgi:hypothetical protein
MKMRKQIELKDAVGKTVEDVIEGDDEVFITFPDDTFIYVGMEYSYGEYYWRDGIQEMDKFKSDAGVQAGAFDKAEYRRQQHEEKLRNEQIEREQYERLKKRFEK